MLNTVSFSDNFPNKSISFVTNYNALFCQEETGAVNAQGQVERRVDTVDYRTSAGGAVDQKPVQVIHQQHDSSTDSNTSGGVLANAAASIASTLESAKQALARK